MKPLRDSAPRPCSLPLGDGPTSRVIKGRRPVVWNRDEEAGRTGGISFSQTDRLSHAAMHVPIRAHDAKTILGVLSVHTYGPHFYGPKPPPPCNDWPIGLAWR